MKRNKALLQPNELSESSKKSMRTRIIAAIVGVIPCLACLFLGDWVFLGLITVLLAIAVYELLNVIQMKEKSMYVIYFLLLALIVYWPIFNGLINKNIDKTWHVYSYFSSLYFPIVILMVGIFALFFTVVLYEKFTVRDACFLATMGLMVALGLQSLLYLRFAPLIGYSSNGVLDFKNTVGSTLLIIFVLIPIMFTDIGAYFFGVLFGKNKMNERISPKKTWEGFFGGVFVGGGLGVLFGLLLVFNGYPLIENCLDAAHFYNVIILSFTLPFIGTLGDFVFSSIKRYYSIKDYGNLIPGHGGILDRLDSVLFGAIFAALYICIFVNAVTGTGSPLI